MEEIKTIKDVLEMDITSALKKQLQDAYIITQKLFGCDYDDYAELTDDRLKYQIARNLYYLSPSDRKEKQKYLNKAYEFNDSISSDKLNDIVIANLIFLLKCRLIKEFIELGEQENLDKAYEFNNSISSDNLDKIDIPNLNFVVKYPLIKEFTELGRQENLDKAYKVLQQVLDNSKGIYINWLIRCASDLLEKYEGLNSKENQHNINTLKDELKKLKEKKNDLTMFLNRIEPNTLLKEQLQNVYKITQESMGECCDNYNKLTDNQLKCQIAHNLYYLSLSDTKEKQGYLDKAYEFNNSISSDKLGDINIADLIFFVRWGLIKEFAELGGQKNLDKAYTVYQQVLNNSEGIDINKLNNLRYDLIFAYLHLENFTQENLDKTKEIFNSIDLETVGNKLKDYIKLQHNILEKEKKLKEEYTKTRSSTSSSSSLKEESIHLSSVEEGLGEMLEEQRQQTHLRYYNPVLSILYDELNQTQPQRSGSAPIICI